MSMPRRVSYSKEMRARAKQDGKELVTIDVPGMLFQGPANEDEVQELKELIVRWLKEELV